MFVKVANRHGPSFLINTAAVTWVQLVLGDKGVEQVNIHFAGGAPLCLPASDELVEALNELAHQPQEG